jgi:transcription initiation factor IIF auxiliary subunit
VPLRPPPAPGTLALRNSARPLDASGSRYEWTVWVTGPLDRVKGISFVRYQLHPTFDPDVVNVFIGPDNGFALTTSGWGEFTVRATAFFFDDSREELEHRLRFRGVPSVPDFGR